MLNTEQARWRRCSRTRSSRTSSARSAAASAQDFDDHELRYGKIILLTDADSDGHHIATLLLTFFYRHMPRADQSGHVFLGVPPLYRIDVGKETHWALDDADKARILKELGKDAKADITRFKGLGEMPPKVLRETTLVPKTRRRCASRSPTSSQTDKVINELMGKDPAARFKFIMEHAEDAATSTSEGRRRWWQASSCCRLGRCTEASWKQRSRRSGQRAADSPKTILVATDFDKCAEAALDQALAIARPLHARVYLFHAYALPVAAFPGASSPHAPGRAGDHRLGARSLEDAVSGDGGAAAPTR